MQIPVAKWCLISIIFSKYKSKCNVLHQSDPQIYKMLILPSRIELKYKIHGCFSSVQPTLIKTLSRHSLLFWGWSINTTLATMDWNILSEESQLGLGSRFGVWINLMVSHVVWNQNVVGAPEFQTEASVKVPM